MREYERGFEDALELCQGLIRKGYDLKRLEKEIEYYLTLVKERKFAQIQYELAAFR